MNEWISQIRTAMAALRENKPSTSCAVEVSETKKLGRWRPTAGGVRVMDVVGRHLLESIFN